MTAPLEVKNAELLPKDGVLIASRRWDSNGARLCVASEGMTLEAMIRQAVERAYPDRDERFYELALSWCRARVDGVEFRRIHWGEVRPVAGQRVEVLVAPGKGGGGKNPLATVLSLVVVVAATVVGQVWAGPAMASALGVTAKAGVAAITAATTAVLAMGGSMLVNALFPVSMPTANASQPELETSQTYSINGGQNSANPNGYVPLVLGRYRMTPPLGAKSWTKQEGDDQYFNMCVIWGHADVAVRDFKIGETPLENFEGVTHVFHGSTTGNDLRFFGKSYNEQSVGATLNHNEPVVRTVGECDSISVDIAFGALANMKSGKPQGLDVQFRLEYALEGTENWKTYGASTRFFAPAQYVDTYTGAGRNDLWASADGTWHTYLGDGAMHVHSGTVRVDDPHWSPYPLENYIDKHKHHEWWTRDAWYDAGLVDYVTISGAQATPLVRTFEWAVPRGRYKVRITRLTADTDDAAIQDTGVWNTSRAIVNRPVFNTPVPVACSELRIKATEELSGYVSNFNAEVVSFVPDWNGTEWSQNETSNPASLLRYCLLSRHGSYTPYSEAKLDEQSFVDFWEHCNANGYTFNFIADTEALTWKRMVQIAAAGRGAVTFDNDGKISVIVDRADKTPVQMFTPRNSWGFSVERAYQKYPHALRASFRNAADNYNEANDYIYADGYDKASATNIVEWEAEGKTSWAEVWKFGRYYLASMRLRPETVTLSTDWEWRMCRRGDLVLVAHDVLTNTFGAARIVGLVYEVDGERVTISREEAKPEGVSPVAVMLDDSVIFSEPAPARYGIAVRQNTGRVLTYEVQPQYGEEANELSFMYSLNSAQVPSIGALASVALFAADGETEAGEYLVAGITPGDNMAADLTLIPYAPQIIDADKGTIPAWTPPVRLSTVPKRDSLPVPVIREIRSDESVIIRSGDSLISRIAVWYGLPSSPDASLGEVQVQMQAKDDFGNVFTASAPLTDPFVAVQGVEDGQAYKVTLRLVSSRGVTSAWTVPHTVPVIGKTSVPPTVDGLTARIADPQGVALEWQASSVTDFDHYEVSGAGGSLKTVNPGATLPVYGKTGTLTFAVQAVDTLGLKSAKVEASVEVLPPAAPAPVYTVEANRGTEISWADCKTTWSIDRYVVEDLWAATTSTYADSRFGVSPRPLGQAYRFLIYAVDVFGNHGPVVDFAASLGSMPAPAPTAKVDGTQVVISWEAIAAPFALEWYEVRTQEGQLVGKVKGTELRFEAPKAGTHGWKVRGIDIAGNIGQWGECSLVLGAPKAPASINVVLSDDRRELIVTWAQPMSDLPVVGYDLVRQYEVERPDGIVETREEDYGRLDVRELRVPAISASVVGASHTFIVRGVDNSGNTGAWASKDIVVQKPGKVTFGDCSPIDNAVQIYFSQPDYVFFAVERYLVEEIEDGYAMEVGTVDAMFFSEERTKGGVYTYGVTPIDTGGNLGERATIALTVGDPPDYLLFYEGDSLFNGERSGMTLDGRGSMIGPVPDETWQENAERSAELLGTAAGDVSWQAKIGAGFDSWLSPALASGSYVEVVDAGTVIPSSLVKVEVTQSALEGRPEMTCRIEVSEDGAGWRVMAEDATSAFAANFRYVRVTLVWTGGMVAVSRIYFDFSVKRKTDFGQAYCRADDADGTEIFFNVAFAEVQSLPKPNVRNDEDGLTAFTRFEGGLTPRSFFCYVKDKNGQRVSATVDWLAGGV